MLHEQHYWSITLKTNALTLPLPKYSRFVTLVDYYEDSHIYRRASLPPIDLFASPEIQLCQLEHNLSTWQNIVGYNKFDPIPQNSDRN